MREPLQIRLRTGDAKTIFFKSLDRAVINLLTGIIAPRCVHHLMDFTEANIPGHQSVKQPLRIGTYNHIFMQRGDIEKGRFGPDSEIFHIVGEII
jgi:hypothetical protein